MLCSKCKSKLVGNANFCHVCGKQIKVLDKEEKTELNGFYELRKQNFYKDHFTPSTKKLIDNLELSWKNYTISKRITRLALFIIFALTIFLVLKNLKDDIYFVFIPLMSLLLITAIELITAPYSEAYKKSLEAVKVRMNFNLCNCANEHNIKEGTGCNCHEEFAEFMRKEYKIKLY